MPVTRAMAVSLAIVSLAAPMTPAQQASDLVGDPDRGKVVFRSAGACVNCHGWAADGRTGINLRSPTGSDLRASELDTAELIEVVRCGRPGTGMPYHDRAAYGDRPCYGMAMSDLDPASRPTRGKTLADKDVVNVVIYLQDHVIGRGKPSFEECAEFFDNPAARACASLK